MKEPKICQFCEWEGTEEDATSIWRITCSNEGCDHYEVLYICQRCEESYINERIKNDTRLMCETCNYYTYGSKCYQYLGKA